MSMAVALPAGRWRWPVSLVAVLALHGAALMVLREVRPVSLPVIPEDAVLLDLAPAAPAPAEQAPAAPDVPQAAAPDQPAVPAPVPPALAPDQPEAAAPEPPQPTAEAVIPPPPPVRSTAEVALPLPAIPRPVPAPTHRKPPVKPPPVKPPRAVAVPAPAPVAEPSRPAAAPPVPSPEADRNGSAGAEAASWASRLAAHLLRFRHYPPDAERRGFTGVATLRFSVDAAGRVVSSSLVRSSGHDELDQEAEAWLHRAQPLPPPPADKTAPAQITVPLSFVLH